MRLSAPIFRLKRQAKLLSRDQNIPLHQALDRVAIGEGFKAWSHLASAASAPALSETIMAGLSGGDMLLLAARPGHGKTLTGLEIAATAHQRQMNGLFFTLDYTREDVARRLQAISGPQHVAADTVEIDTSDEICADHIIRRLRATHGPSIAVIDYLQLLDQRRSTPDLDHQLASLKQFIAGSGDIIVAISQVDRAFEAADRKLPDLGDIRLPNPVDLGRFTRTCFLHDGVANFSA